jgi:hypothetical protein
MKNLRLVAAVLCGGLFFSAQAMENEKSERLNGVLNLLQQAQTVLDMMNHGKINLSEDEKMNVEMNLVSIMNELKKTDAPKQETKLPTRKKKS